MSKRPTSEAVFEFIRNQSTPRTITFDDGTLEHIPAELTEDGLAAALDALVKLIEVECGYELNTRSLDAHLNEHGLPMSGPTGIVN